MMPTPYTHYRPVRYLALGWLALLVVAGLLAPYLPLPYAPAVPDLLHPTAAPGWQGTAPHYLGTDPLGRDVLANVLFGARQLLELTLPAGALATVAAALLGGAAGYWGNRGLRLPWPVIALAGALLGTWLRPPLAATIALGLAGLGWLWRGGRLPLDSLLLGTTTLLGTLPRLVLVLVLAAGPPLAGGWLLSLLALLAWPDMARLVRARMLQVRSMPYLEAARAAGLPEARIWWRQALPAACQPLRTYAPLVLASLVGLESTLSFLGLGGSPATASWGQLLSQLRQAPEAWWLLAFPGTALLATILALQTLGRRA